MEFNNLGIKNENITFTEFIELVRREVMRNNLNNCVALTEKYGLSSMTMNEINEEIKSVRNAKKSSLITMLLFPHLFNGLIHLK
jgi:hypothetical protein